MEIKVIPKNLGLLKQAYLHTTVNNLTINDIYIKGHSCWCKCTCTCCKEVDFKLTSVIRSRNKSCGCAVSPEAASERNKAFWKNHPEKLAARANKYHEWCVNNPDKVKEKSDKVSEFYKAHPEVADSNGKKVSEWYKSNPDKVALKASNFSLWCRENTEIVASIGDKVRQWHRDPDNVKRKSEAIKNKFKENPTIVENRIKQFKITKTASRVSSLQNLSLDFVHPDDLDLLLKGIINTRSSVRTKCPLCGKYDTHEVKNFVNIKDCFIHTVPMCRNCHSSFYISKQETEIYEYISSFYSGKCVRNDRSVLNGKELDLYYPEKNIAIEFNGMYWHSDTQKPNDYHFNKFIECKNRGIRLISIFEQDWIHNNYEVRALLRDALSDHVKIYASKCKCFYTSLNSEIAKFLHLSNKIKDVRIVCLSYNDILLSAMAFTHILNSTYALEAYRCLDCYTVVGGASKMFTRFTHDYAPCYITGVSNNDLFLGTIYETLGFSFIKYIQKYQMCNTNTIVNFENCDCEINNKDSLFKVYRCGESLWKWHSQNV